MPTTTAVFLVFAFMTSVVMPLGRLFGVQPSSRLSWGPTVAPFGPQPVSGTTPVFVVALNAPIVVTGPVTVVGSITSRPPLQLFGERVQPGGLLMIVG